MAHDIMINCGLCKRPVDLDETGVRASYHDNEMRGLCKTCLDFLVSFSLTSSFDEAEKVVKAEPQRFQYLKEKLEIV
tara:strand:- start:302 stop:532 length:231 start_codon:yes stop_codon:yes gene_type:complete